MVLQLSCLDFSKRQTQFIAFKDSEEHVLAQSYGQNTSMPRVVCKRASDHLDSAHGISVL